jgi:peptidoglycan/LPS O-acetylase OafA/YrhL
MLKIKFDHLDCLALKKLSLNSTEKHLKSRNLSIDILRGIAVLLVLLHHFNIPYKLADTSLSFNVFGQSFVHAIARNGNYGVTIFFVISGFLITSHSLRRWGELHQIDAKRFYWSRVARIMPSLILLLLMVNGLGWLELKPFMNQATNGVAVSTQLVNVAALTFWMNQLIIDFGWVNYALGVLWSLSVEEVFYLSFPLACLLIKQQKWLIAFLAAFIIVAPIYRFFHQGESGAYLYGYFASFDGIAIGSITAILAQKIWLDKPVPKILPVIVAMAMVAFYLSVPIAKSNIWGISLMALGTAILLLWSVNRWQQPMAKQSNPLILALGSIGRHSYEIYLFHLVVLGLIKVACPPSTIHGDYKIWLLIVFMLGTLSLSYVIARFYSNPLNDGIRARFIKRT